MEELIKRLERVIHTGAPDKDGLHPISAETVLEVIKTQLGTNLAEVGTDCISRQAAIDAIMSVKRTDNIKSVAMLIMDLPSAEPQIIRCKDCRYYKQFGKSEWGDCLALSRICKSIDFCSWGARMDSEQILSEADNDTAYGGLMSAT